MVFRRWAPVLLLIGALATASWINAQTSRKGAQPSRQKSAASGDAKLQAALEDREQAGWKAYKDKDKKAFAELVTDDYTAGIADGKGVRDRQGTIDSMDEITLHRYALSDFKLTPLGANAALLTYRAEINYSGGDGQPQDSKLYVSDLWVKRGRQWKSLHYQETEYK